MSLTLPPDLKREILANPVWLKANTARERWADASLRVSIEERIGSTPSPQALYRLEKWKAFYPFDDEQVFAERLALDQWTQEEFLALLEDTPSHPLSSPSAWLDGVAEAIDAAVRDDLDAIEERLFAASWPQVQAIYQTSFLSAFRPLIAHGVARFHIQVERMAAHPLDLQTTVSLWFAHLPAHLSAMVNRTLTMELQIARLEERLQGETPEERFHTFIQHMAHLTAQHELYARYPVLTRRVMETIEQWQVIGLEFFRRLIDDWEAICATIFDGNPGTLTEIKAGAGDAHKGGRSTLICRFSGGATLVYKPRSLAIDQHFQAFLDWLNHAGNHPPFKTIRVLDKQDYGWSEYVEAQPCQSLEEVARFYRRQGAFLAILYALEAVDVHYENLIASGEHPVLIDLESLFHPRDQGTDDDSAREAMAFSVLRIGLLPARLWGDEQHEGIDLSGLGGPQGQITPFPVLQVASPGTDTMHVIRQRIAYAPAKTNLPTLDGHEIDLFAYTDDLIAGFSEMYSLLARLREDVLAGPLQDFAADEIRYIMRPTRIYARLLQESYHPDVLTNMLDRDRFFDALWRSIPTRPYLRQVVVAEQADLQAGDIPFFTTTPSTHDVYTSRGERLPGFIGKTSFAIVTDRLRQMDEKDLQRQCWFIRASLVTMRVEDVHSVPRRMQQETRSDREPVARDEILQAAVEIGRRLETVAFLQDDAAQWLSLIFINEREWQLRPAGIDIYHGRAGIAHFLAYLGHLTDDPAFTTLAHHAVQAIQQNTGPYLQHMQNLGAMSGWGGIIYLYAHLGALWKDEEYWQRAETLVSQTRHYIAEDRMLDILGGTAGYLAALLALYAVHPTDESMAAAVACGEHLLACEPWSVEKRDTSFGLPASRPLTGISHGAAGYALSLLRLAQISHDDRFRQAATSALAYERSTFSAERQNWPDFRVADAALTEAMLNDQMYMCAWCHGAAGIGMSRLAMLDLLPDPQFEVEIAAALQTTLSEGFGWSHTVCHGDLGNLDLLLLAREKLPIQDFAQEMATITHGLLSSFRAGRYLTGTPMHVEIPGFLIGLSGIGYQLLRLAEPERIPSLLTLAPPRQ